MGRHLAPRSPLHQPENLPHRKLQSRPRIVRSEELQMKAATTVKIPQKQQLHPKENNVNGRSTLRCMRISKATQNLKLSKKNQMMWRMENLLERTTK
jgi:hypothetical protein